MDSDSQQTGIVVIVAPPAAMQNTLKIDVRYQVISFPCIITVIMEING